MSKSTNAIQEIKNLMVKFGFMSEETTLQSFKLEDETILQAEKLEAGHSIVKINEAFEQVSLEDGSYRLKEKFEIEVSEGKITSVKEIFEEEEKVEEVEEEKVEEKEAEVVEPEVEVPSDEPSEEPKEAEFSKQDEVLEMFKDFIGKVNEKMSSLENELKTVKSDFSSFKSGPAAPKVKDGKTEQFNKQEDDIDSKVSNILSLRNNNKK
jgi:hypothetical protein